MRVVIDNRESSFIEFFSEKVKLYPFIQFEVASLDLGDIEIHYNDQLLFVWERKTFSDLFSSIKDGRYKEQCYRLVNVYGSKKVIYLIEGIMNQLNDTERKLAVSTITTLSLKKGFHLWRSVHVQDSVNMFLQVCDKIHRDVCQGKWVIEAFTTEPKDSDENLSEQVGKIDSNYVEYVKKNKKENVTRDNIGELFLCQIPHVSTSSAKALMNSVNGNFSQLIHIVQNTPEILYDIKLDGSKPRKISKLVIEKIVEYLRERD